MEKIIAAEISPQGIDSELITFLENECPELSESDAIMYYGFPIFKDYEDISIRSNILVLSKTKGILLIQSSNTNDLSRDDENLTQLFNLIDAALKKSKLLRKGKREISIPINSLIFSFDASDTENDVSNSYEELIDYIEEIDIERNVSEVEFQEARSIIEGSKALSRSIKRTKISDDPATKLNILINLENEVSNFDIEQRKIAISLINGPQRIRGLAGSGKTVILAMKAAHIHLQYPEKKILFTFYTKSLYGIIKQLIAKFFRHFASGEPNWDNIDVLHSWGGKNIDGVYYNACSDNFISPMSFSSAKSLNSLDPFAAACSHALQRPIDSKYDYILIDEAQDLPNEFFQICYDLAIGNNGDEKNIVWAYDELQSIFNVYQRTPTELFGTASSGLPRIDLDKFKLNLSFGQTNDLVLFKCYRNPLEVLITAHALGFGLYSNQIVQILENEEHWKDVGYRLENGCTLKINEKVKITRDRENSPLSIYEYQSSKDIIKTYKANSIDDECAWIVHNITESLKQGLKPHDILVICLDDINAKAYFSRISILLGRVSIRSNNILIATSAAPPFTIDDMVTLSTVHRAKGNEAAEVYAVGMDAIYPYRESRNGRNKIFTAFTRTRAWLNVSGVGSRAQLFLDEIETSLKYAPSLIFKVPDMDKIATIQRDLNSTQPEFTRIQELIGDLKQKGYTEEQIQHELNFGVNDGSSKR